MLQLLLVPPDHVETVWSVVEPGMLKCVGRLDGFTYSDREIRTTLNRGDGDRLLLILEGNEYRGFMTTGVIVWGGELTLLVGKLFYTGHPDSLAEVVPPLKEYAEAVGCKRISSLNGLKGFQRIAPKLGLKPRIIEYTMEV